MGTVEQATILRPGICFTLAALAVSRAERSGGELAREPLIQPVLPRDNDLAGGMFGRVLTTLLNQGKLPAEPRPLTVYIYHSIRVAITGMGAHVSWYSAVFRPRVGSTGISDNTSMGFARAKKSGSASPKSSCSFSA